MDSNIIQWKYDLAHSDYNINTVSSLTEDGGGEIPWVMLAKASDPYPGFRSNGHTVSVYRQGHETDPHTS